MSKTFDSSHENEEILIAVASDRRKFVPGAGHVDLYDRVNMIPLDKLPSFFNKHLV